jgi:CheY-like chemotaxis protein
LLAEDDVRTAQTLSQMLREDGYDVEVVLDGAAAMNSLSRRPAPDVLLVDYRLPLADGLAVAAFGRAHHPHLPIVMITSYSEIVARSLLRPAGAPITLISKPVTYDDLARQIETALTGRHVARASTGAR